MLKKLIQLYISVLLSATLFAQSQPCPVNINFGDGTLTNWGAFTGMFNGSRASTTVTQYASTLSAPNGTINVSNIDEYYGKGGNGVIVPGIYINTVNSTDYFGGFSTIPNINGYQYTNSVTLGSTTVWGSSQKGLVRGVSYKINVPAGSPLVPYTMTYAYAMVLENGSHANNQQPLAKATLTRPDGTIIDCASPSYYLPTFGQNNDLDVTTARQQGFSQSANPSPNQLANSGSLYRVWYKPWTEVTFNLSAYRGQQVTLTFEADNCVPGGHFSYAYFAIRKECDGLQISGPQIACINASAEYSVPALPGSTSYQWVYPAGWTARDSSNFLFVKPNNQPGTIQVTQHNSCDTLTSSLNVNVSTPTVAGSVVGSDSVCSGNNSSILALTGNTGGVLKWLASTDGINWNAIPDTLINYTAANLTQTTIFKTIVQNGGACSADTSGGAIVNVSAKSIGGKIIPDNLTLCLNQNKDNTLTLTGHNGNILNWQFSYDTLTWQNTIPKNTDTTQTAVMNNIPTQYRAVVKNEICPADTSNIAYTAVYNSPYPQANIAPSDTAICYGDSATLRININTATSYTWQKSTALTDANNGNIPPYNFSAVAKPLQTFNYIIGFKNNTCPNTLYDTTVVKVFPRISLTLPIDTTIVINEPLQLTAIANVTEPLSYAWTPTSGLNNPFIYNPIATLGLGYGDTLIYNVKATDSIGCYGENSIRVVLFKTKPDIFVPSAFTPNDDRTNDVVYAVPVGIKTFVFFNIYNRLGQLVFTTPDPEKGWDGNLNGYKQASGTYVYMAKGIDYLGNVVFRKGTIVLIR